MSFYLNNFIKLISYFINILILHATNMNINVIYLSVNYE